jgi:hypothetical protein
MRWHSSQVGDKGANKVKDIWQEAKWTNRKINPKTEQLKDWGYQVSMLKFKSLMKSKLVEKKVVSAKDHLALMFQSKARHD